MTNYEKEAAALIGRFRARNEELRAAAEKEENRVSAFLLDFSKRVNDPIADIVEAIKAAIGESNPGITITPASDKSGLWYEVTITAKPEGQEERKRTLRFTADPIAQTVVLQSPDSDGRYSSINGAVPIERITPDGVSRRIIELLTQALGPDGVSSIG